MSLARGMYYKNVIGHGHRYRETHIVLHFNTLAMMSPMTSHQREAEAVNRFQRRRPPIMQMLFLSTPHPTTRRLFTACIATSELASSPSVELRVQL